MVTVLNKLVKRLELTPCWLLEGKTIFISKRTTLKTPPPGKNHCLLTTYKALTSIWNNMVVAHLKRNIELPADEEDVKCIDLMNR